VFYSTLGQIERNAEKGKFTPQPYDYLTTGRVSRLPQLRTDGILSAAPAPQPAYSKEETACKSGAVARCVCAIHPAAEPGNGSPRSNAGRAQRSRKKQES